MFQKTTEEDFQGMEVWAQHFEAKGFSWDEYLRFSHLFEKDTLVHAPSWDINLASMSEKIRRGSINETLRAVDFALMVGSKELTVHPGQASNPLLEEASLDRLYQSLKEIFEYSYPRGLKISLEIMEKLPLSLVYSTGTAERATRDLFGLFSYTVDAAHCDSEEEIFSLLRTLPEVSKIHISNRWGNRLHTPLFLGDHDFSRILPRLGEMGIPLVVEGLDRDVNFPVLRSNIFFVEEIMKDFRCKTGAGM